MTIARFPQTIRFDDVALETQQWTIAEAPVHWESDAYPNHLMIEWSIPMRTISTMLFVALAFSASFAGAADKLAVGAKAPDFEVTNAEGKKIKLSERLKKDKTVVVMFSRAKW